MPLEVASDWPRVDFDLTVVRIVLDHPSVQAVQIDLWQVGSDRLETVDWDLVSVVDRPVVAEIVVVAVAVAAVVAEQPTAIVADYQHSVAP